ncbi:cytochrome P450 2K6-like [Varanus komodoensis]|uniref:cytochrome P450 2K6-like n=1 Tax=Varanus komodoensis TaxID=61221 RepID=UPI001CF7CA56|nr:cytochrome P450 2K6-like [Varanus komodoensis]
MTPEARQGGAMQAPRQAVLPSSSPLPCPLLSAAAQRTPACAHPPQHRDRCSAVRWQAMRCQQGGLLGSVAPALWTREKVHKEIQDVFGSSCSVCYEDKRKLPYTNAVIHEILRSKYPLFFGLPRQSTKALSMNGIPIPKGARIIADLCSVLHDPKYWETPHEFNPNHFLDKEFLSKHRRDTGEGRRHQKNPWARVCVGEQLAQMELFLFLTSLLRAFQFQLPDGVEKLSQEPVMQFTCHPRPYKIRAIPR